MYQQAAAIADRILGDNDFSHKLKTGDITTADLTKTVDFQLLGQELGDLSLAFAFLIERYQETYPQEVGLRR